MAVAISVPNIPNIVDDRKMLSRTIMNQVQLVGHITPGKNVAAWFECCHAPEMCPCCSIFPCVLYPEYIGKKIEASRYVWLRENSIEWNEPVMISKEGACCGQDLCLFRVLDRVTVLYFDDPSVSRIADKTRACNDCRTCCCGGRGERVVIDSPCCCGMCLRSWIPCCYIPCCCPEALSPCAIRYQIYVENGAHAVAAIKEARQSAQQRLGVGDD